MKRWYSFLLLSLLLGGLVACNRDSGNKEMEEGATAFLDAVLANDGDYVETHTCANVPSRSGSQDFLAMWSIGLAIRASNDVQFSGLNVGVGATTIESTEEDGLVQMEGTVSFPSTLLPSDQMPLPVDDFIEFDETWHMVLENETWKWCGGVFE